MLSGTMPSLESALTIGSAVGGSFYGGYMREFKISKGIARWEGYFNHYREKYCVPIEKLNNCFFR